MKFFSHVLIPFNSTVNRVHEAEEYFFVKGMIWKWFIRLVEEEGRCRKRE